MKHLLCAFLATFMFASTVQAEESLSKKQQEEVRKLVRDTIMANPEILVEAMEGLQARQEQARLEQQKNTLKHVRFETDTTPLAGNLKGDITLVEFFDYQCGYCKRAFPGVMEVVNSDKNIRYVLKEFAILGPDSEIAARAALAANMQDKYMEFHTAMMTVRGRLNEDKIMKTAASIGLNVDKLKKDMQSEGVNVEIQSTRAIAQALGITGTPAFIIGDEVIPGAVPPAALKEVIARQRAKK